MGRVGGDCHVVGVVGRKCVARGRVDATKVVDVHHRRPVRVQPETRRTPTSTARLAPHSHATAGAVQLVVLVNLPDGSRPRESVDTVDPGVAAGADGTDRDFGRMAQGECRASERTCRVVPEVSVRSGGACSRGGLSGVWGVASRTWMSASAQGAVCLLGVYQWLKPLATVARRGGESHECVTPSRVCRPLSRLGLPRPCRLG